MATIKSIEEKAKAYDEAIKKVNDYYEGKTKLYSDVDKTLDYLFPELKESEDEKIRKWLIGQLKQGLATAPKDVNPNNAEKAIAWLEKQGGQKAADKVEPKFKVGDKVIYLNEKYEIVNITDHYILHTTRRNNVEVLHLDYDKEELMELVEEPVSDELEKAAREFIEPYREISECGIDYNIHPARVFKSGANWQKEQIITKACEWISSNIGYRAWIMEFKKSMEE